MHSVRVIAFDSIHSHSNGLTLIRSIALNGNDFISSRISSIHGVKFVLFPFNSFQFDSFHLFGFKLFHRSIPFDFIRFNPAQAESTIVIPPNSKDLIQCDSIRFNSVYPIQFKFVRFIANRWMRLVAFNAIKFDLIGFTSSHSTQFDSIHFITKLIPTAPGCELFVL